MYTAILLNDEDRDRLNAYLTQWFNCRSWQVYCHHLTLNMGPASKGLNNPEIIGQEAIIQVDATGMNDHAAACRATKMVTKDGTELKSTNKTPHITMAVNVHDGGKPVMSNDIKWWIPLDNKNFCGKLVEIG